MYCAKVLELSRLRLDHKIAFEAVRAELTQLYCRLWRMDDPEENDLT